MDQQIMGLTRSNKMTRYIYVTTPTPSELFTPPPSPNSPMHASLFVLLLSAIASFANAVPASEGDNAPRGLVVAREPTRVKLPRAAAPNVAHNVPRAKPAGKYDNRRSYVPRAKPSGKDGDTKRRNVVARTKPSGKDGDTKRRNVVVVAARAKPSGKDGDTKRRNVVVVAARAKPSGKSGDSKRSSHYISPRGKKAPEKDEERRKYASGVEADGTHRANARRSQQEQDAIGAGQGWDQCPAPLEACPVRGASDADDFECVDLWSDLDSCGGCAAEDSAYDCNTIPNARGVECISGYCVVHSCMAGYTVALAGDGCVPRRSEKRLL